MCVCVCVCVCVHMQSLVLRPVNNHNVSGAVRMCRGGGGAARVCACGEGGGGNLLIASSRYVFCDNLKVCDFCLPLCSDDTSSSDSEVHAYTSLYHIVQC